MEKKSKNICISVIQVPRVPSLAVSISWYCPQTNWYTLTKLKKGYNTNDSQFEQGSECMTLCYSLYQRIKERKDLSYNNTKHPIDCLNCNVQNERFQICYTTSNKLSYLKKTLKDIIKELDPSRINKQYTMNMKNLGAKINRDEFNYVLSELMKSLKKEIYIAAVGNIKLSSVKKGSLITPSQNLKELADGLSKIFPHLKEPLGKKIKPTIKKHIIPEFKVHFLFKIKSNKNPLISVLVADYIKKTLSINTTVLGKDIIIWAKDPSVKLKSIRKKDRYIREMLGKKEINGQIAYNSIENCVDNKCVIKFYNLNPSPSEIAKEVIDAL